MKPLVAVVFLMTLSGSVLHAQQQPIQLKMGDVKVEQPVFDAQKTPNFQAGDVKTKDVPNPKDWLEVEVEFEVDGPRNAVVKELLFRYYVAFADQNNQTKTLTGDVKHVNVVCGEKTFSAAYVAPSMLGEITGDFRRFQPGAVKGVGLEVIYNGVVVGGATTGGGKFWESTGTSPGVLGKAKTPFALLWIDRYAEVAEDR
jgi:hypothetical protein